MSFYSHARFRAVVTTGLLLGITSLSWAGEVQLGERLFTRAWSHNDPLSPDGDGLGPVFNARSCVACHNQAGVGGGGGAKHDVDLLALKNSREVRSAPKSRRDLIQRIHPGLAAADNVILHKHGAGTSYQYYRGNILVNYEFSYLRPWGRYSPRKLRVRKSREKGVDLIEVGPVILQFSKRNTPSLFGSGLIDRIRSEALTNLATKQASNSPRLAGRGLGKFGWRGQSRTLAEFVSGACANELGLQTAQNKQLPDPTDPDYRIEGVDMDQRKVDALADFIGSLPQPRRLSPREYAEQNAWNRGEGLFKKARCIDCHVEQLDQVTGIYSDLLLHDMGESLEDPIPAPLRGGSTYYGGSGGGPAVATRLWRTPPLWGVRDTAPYLHDGRAHTLDQAIRMHDGQAEPSAQYYASLSTSERADLLGFVKSLGSP